VARALSRLGKRIRALRLARKLTQERAAETAKLDEKHWQDIEGGRTNPTVATLVGITRALDVALHTLFEQDDDEKRSSTPSRSPATPSGAGPSAPAPRSRPRPRSRSPRRRG
jgi:transcriptional regulator with XRE-family HTH domain